MDFTLDEEQEALRDAVRGLLKQYDPSVDAERRRSVTANRCVQLGRASVSVGRESATPSVRYRGFTAVQPGC